MIIVIAILQPIFDLNQFVASGDIESGKTTLIRIRALDKAGSFGQQSYFWLEYDKTQPKFIGSFKSHEGANDLNIELINDPKTNPFFNSGVTNPIVTDRRPKISFKVQDQQFAARHNQLKVRLLVNGVDVPSTYSPTILAQGKNFGTFVAGSIKGTLAPSTKLDVNKESKLSVQVTDLAGNIVTSQELTVFVKGANLAGAPTLSAPGTPARTDLYYLGARLLANADKDANVIIVDQNIPSGLSVFINGEGNNSGNLIQESTSLPNGGFKLTLESKLAKAVVINEKVAWLRPWQMSFDKSTQTVWFTFEDGYRLGQFDPATGKTKIFDVSMTSNVNGVTAATATDPHGAFFDFNSHLTPRVWFVYRNDVLGDATARVSYFDITSEKLFSFSFNGFKTTPELNDRLEGSHAIFVDALGDVWFTAEEGGNTGGGSIVHLNFDKNGTLGSDRGKVTVHQIPVKELTATTTESFHVHGVQVIVDDSTGQQYVYFLDANTDGSRGKNTGVGLLVPGGADGTNPIDRWFRWDALPAENDNSNRNSHLLFTAIDDNETPGIPNDDRLIFTDPGRQFPVNGKGVVTLFEMNSLITAIQKDTKIPSLSGKQIVVSKLPGTASTKESGANQAFIDRQGTIFAVDPQGGAIRFSFDEAVDVTETTAPSKVTEAQNSPLIGELTFDPVALPHPIEIHTIQDGDDELSNGIARLIDRSSQDGIDHYEVAVVPERRTLGGAGPFRGALNATNVLYGSISQSDHISTTVFAETARRQLAVVNSPVTPTGQLEGRLAFQVLRDGSLRLTGRADGQILDTQINLSKLTAGSDLVLPKVSVYGEVSAVVDNQHRVHVVGKQKFNGAVRIVVFTYSGSWSNQSDLAQRSNWSVKQLYGGSDLLVGDPTTYFDEQVNKVRTLVTTNTGKLLLFEADRTTPVVLGQGFRGADGQQIPVFSSVGIVHQGNWTFAYGTNQSGNLIEIGFKRDLTASYTAVIEANSVARHEGQTARDLRVFQDVEVTLVGSTRHIYATDGNSRLVHYSIDRIRNVVWAENVSKKVNERTNQSNVEATGYFPFQADFVGRVYSGLEVLKDSANTQFVYGTNGGELILFIKKTGEDWRLANLTNDVFSPFDDNNSITRVPGNNVFGSPGGYAEANGDRHLFQINKEGEVIEYYLLANESMPRFHTQNIDFLNK